MEKMHVKEERVQQTWVNICVEIPLLSSGLSFFSILRAQTAYSFHDIITKTFTDLMHLGKCFTNIP